MKGVLLVNFGGAATEQELKILLYKMFSDPKILPVPCPLKKIIALRISRKRSSTSWKKYCLINGTPVFDETNKIAVALQNELPDHHIATAYSYSPPYIPDALDDLTKKKINDIIIIPLYPQYSLCTTGSIEAAAAKYTRRHKTLKIRFIREYHNNHLFIRFWSERIISHIKAKDYKDPVLVFSAHSIPLSLIRKGDTYSTAVEECAELISRETGYRHIVTYQSAINNKRWLGPPIRDTLQEISEGKQSPAVLIPVSFVTENLETLYDLDRVIIPEAMHEYNIHQISRVPVNMPDDNFISCLKELVYEYDQ